jgi:hypothetical protein
MKKAYGKNSAAAPEIQGYILSFLPLPIATRGKRRRIQPGLSRYEQRMA